MKAWMALASLILVQDVPKQADPSLEAIEKKVKALALGLRQAKASQDPEVRDRASRILQELERPVVHSREDVDALILEIPAQNFVLRKQIEFLTQSSRVPVVVTGRVEAAGVMDAETEIAARTNVSLARVLDEICRANRMAWSVKNGCVVLDLAKPVEGKSQVKTYDLRSLVLRMHNASMRPIGLVEMMSAAGSGVPDLQEPNPPIISADDLVTLIQENVDPRVWEESDQYWINMSPNLELLVAAPDETHKKIKTYLQGIHKLVNRQWEARLWLITLSSARAVRLPEELGQGAWDSLRRLSLEGKDATLLANVRLMGYPGQKVSSVSGTAHSIIREYTADGQPVTEEISDGVKLWIRGTPDDSGKVLADMQFSVSKVLSVEKLSTKRGEISMPELAHSELFVRRQFAPGIATVLGRLPGSAMGKSGQDTLVLVAVFTSFTPE